MESLKMQYSVMCNELNTLRNQYLELEEMFCLIHDAPLSYTMDENPTLKKYALNVMKRNDLKQCMDTYEDSENRAEWNDKKRKYME